MTTVDCTWTPDGRYYVGHTSVTVSGGKCQAWTSQSPHSHSFDQDDMFPDSSAAAALNYCRNPDDDPAGLWCYTTDPGKRWEYCDVPSCGQSSQFSLYRHVFRLFCAASGDPTNLVKLCEVKIIGVLWNIIRRSFSRLVSNNAIN